LCFFFQAEDGIRDKLVTGVQTCALPIFMLYKAGNPRNLGEIGQQLGVAHVLEGNVQRAGGKVRVNAQLVDTRTDKHLWGQTYDRSEERRVGKECRSRWWPDQCRKKEKEQ